MAQYWTDFEGESVGEQPSSWTRRWATSSQFLIESDATASNGIAAKFEPTNTSNTHRIVTWDDVDSDPDRDNVEIVCRFSSPVESNTERRCRLLSRGSNPLSDRTGYVIGPAATASTSLRIVKYVSPDFSGIAESGWDGVGQDEWWLVRTRVSGNNLRLRVWKDGDPEPSAWDLEATDSDITDPGWVGVFIFDGSVITKVDWFGVGTDGDPAPTGPVDDGGQVATVSENYGTTSVFSARLISRATVSESVTTQDVSIGVKRLFGTVSEFLDYQDSVSSVKKMVASVTESFTSQDSSFKQATLLTNLNENTNYSAIEQAKINLFTSLVDGYTSNDIWATKAFLIAENIETLTTTDTYTAEVTGLDQNIVREESQFLDLFSAAAQMLGLVSETQTIGDVAIAVARIARTVTEQLDTQDQYTSVVKAIRNVTESTNYTDTVTATISTTVEQVFESMELSDIVRGQSILKAIVSENISWSDRYRFPTAVGFIEAVIAIKTYLDGQTQIKTYISGEQKWPH